MKVRSSSRHERGRSWTKRSKRTARRDLSSERRGTISLRPCVILTGRKRRMEQPRPGVSKQIGNWPTLRLPTMPHMLFGPSALPPRPAPHVSIDTDLRVCPFPLPPSLVFTSSQEDRTLFCCIRLTPSKLPFSESCKSGLDLTFSLAFFARAYPIPTPC